MKILTLFLIPLIFLSSCTIDWNDEKDKKIAELSELVSIQEKTMNDFSGRIDMQQGDQSRTDGETKSQTGIYSDDLIQFVYTDPNMIAGVRFMDTSHIGIHNEIMLLSYYEAGNIYTLAQSLEEFHKNDTDTPEGYISSIIDNNGGESKKCNIISSNYEDGENNYLQYTIDLKNKSIIYTPQEIERIKKADKEAKGDHGPFDGEWMKTHILNEHRISTCSRYADKGPDGTSKASLALFIGDKKNTFVFMPASADPSAIKAGSLIFKEK